jgi:hypothetical protein
MYLFTQFSNLSAFCYQNPITFQYAILFDAGDVTFTVIPKPDEIYDESFKDYYLEFFEENNED